MQPDWETMLARFAEGEELDQLLDSLNREWRLGVLELRLKRQASIFLHPSSQSNENQRSIALQALQKLGEDD